MDTPSIDVGQRLIQKTVIQTLLYGEIDILGQLMIGSNASLLVTLKLNDTSFQAVYKPDLGEQPLWDFPRNTLSRRETAAFLIAQLSGWDFVPPTVYRTHKTPYGKGSMQLFIPHDPRINFFNLPNKTDEALQKIVLFDIIINNADRKAGHVIQGDNGRIWLIDHGLCFHHEYKLRTVIWDYANTRIPDARIKDLNRLLIHLKSDKISMAKKLTWFLSSAELFMVTARLEQLLAAGCFPSFEQDRRPYPWPLI